MENEAELGKDPSKHTDSGYSEVKLAKQVDLGIASKTTQTVHLFTPQKKTQTLFQAQKVKEK